MKNKKQEDDNDTYKNFNIELRLHDVYEEKEFENLIPNFL